jgi:hypothetical protein
MHTALVLRFFPAPTLDGGAFFALPRLVLHMEAGSPIDRSLAFVQRRLFSSSLLAAWVGDVCSFIDSDSHLICLYLSCLT